MMTSNAGTDLIMKLCADPETCPDAGRAGRGAAPGTVEDLQAGVPGPRDAGALFSALRRRHAADRGVATRADCAAGGREPPGRRSTTTRSWWPASPPAAPRSTAGPATWTTSSPARCCRRCRPSSLPGWPRPGRSPNGQGRAGIPTGTFRMSFASDLVRRIVLTICPLPSSGLASPPGGTQTKEVLRDSAVLTEVHRRSPCAGLGSSRRSAGPGGAVRISRVLEAEPDRADAWHLLGAAMHQLGDSSAPRLIASAARLPLTRRGLLSQ